MNLLFFKMTLLTVVLRTTIVMMGSHWLMIWMGFEMNMLAIISVLMKQYNPRSMEVATKYFLTEATASVLLMLAIIINLSYSGQWTFTKLMNPTVSIITSLALALKMGLAPFHFWVPEVTPGISLSSSLILLTWQKLAPLSILYVIIPVSNLDLILLMCTLSIAVGVWGGLNQTELCKI